MQGKKKEIIQSIFKVFDDPESRGCVLCDVFHSFVCFVVNVQSSCQRVSRHFFHIVFLIFSILSPFFLLSFTTKQNQILIIFFHYQGHNFFIVFLSIPKLVYVIFLLCLFFSPFLCPGFSDPQLSTECSSYFPISQIAPGKQPLSPPRKCTSPSPRGFFLFADVLSCSTVDASCTSSCGYWSISHISTMYP